MPKKLPEKYNSMKMRLRIQETLQEKGEALKIKNMNALAERMDVDYNTVVFWNTGRVLPQLKRFFILCIMLQVDPLEIVEIEEN